MGLVLIVVGLRNEVAIDHRRQKTAEGPLVPRPGFHPHHQLFPHTQSFRFLFPVYLRSAFPQPFQSPNPISSPEASWQSAKTA